MNMITHIGVTEACASDEHVAMPVLKALDERGQRPKELVDDTAHGSAANTVAAKHLGTELVSPVRGSSLEVPIGCHPPIKR